jgi:hypothetical protein
MNDRVLVMRALCAAASVAMGSAAMAQSCPSAPLVNGGFESGTFSGWTQSGNTGFTAVNMGTFIAGGPVVHGGTYVAHFGPVTTPGTISQVVTANPTDIVTIDFWYAVYTATGSTATNSFSADFDGQNLYAVTNDTTNTAWTHFTYTVVAANANPTLSFTLRNDPSYDFLDDITVCVAPGVGACCHPANNRCSLVVQSSCPAGDNFMGTSTVCVPTPCSATAAGVCCRGSTCNTTVSTATCLGNGLAGAVHTASGSTCNSGGSTTTPCCFADYNKTGGVTVGDIFDFLNDWFAASPYANFGGDGSPATLAVQNIFDFLNAWFAGGCAP